ncbi:unnamed protein product [Aspergillus oryzae]|nr:unnamed protein product [Aspergillus oryzae]GMF86888.1 unnamed protein product [Aspergillus oryzae]
MLPIVFLSTLVASATAVTTASNYTFPEGFDLNQVKPADKCSQCGSKNASDASGSSSSTTTATSLPTSTGSSGSSKSESSSTGTATSSGSTSSTTANVAVRMAQDHATCILATFAQYLDALRKSEGTTTIQAEISPLLEPLRQQEQSDAEPDRKQRDEVLKKLVSAASVLNNAPEKGGSSLQHIVQARRIGISNCMTEQKLTRQ